jgi:hypothetical protein
MATTRPTAEQVLELAPNPAAAAAALAAAVPSAWSAAGHDDVAVWGQYVATSAEPYAVAIDLSDDAAGPAYRCTCPSRRIPCKHALGLLLLEANGGVVAARRLPFADEWLRRRAGRAGAERSTTATSLTDGDPAAAAVPAGAGAAAAGQPATAGASGAVRTERHEPSASRAERMRLGLIEFERWLQDRVRAGLAHPSSADPQTWERAAARLVDAQCGGLANRLRRVQARIGARADWHEDVLAELGILHLLACGGLRTGTLPDELADGVRFAAGLTVAK